MQLNSLTQESNKFDLNLTYLLSEYIDIDVVYIETIPEMNWF